MYPDLSYFFNDIIGTARDNWTSMFKSFGLMLGLAFLACGILLKSELKRLEGLGWISSFKAKIAKNPQAEWPEIITNAIILGILGAKLPLIASDFSKFSGDPAALLFSKLGNWWIGLLVGGSFIAYFAYKKKQEKASKVEFIESNIYPHQKTMDIIIVAAISGVLGSRLLSIFENLDDFFRDPLGQLFSGQGLTVYGGLILAFIAVYFYIKKLGIKPVYMMDIAGMGILLGYAIGRIGCQVSGDGDWGIVAAAQPDWWFLPDWIWSYHYPNNVNNDGIPMQGCDGEKLKMAVGQIEDRCKTVCGIRYCHELSPKVYPTPIYETTICLLGFGVLYFFRNKIKIAGILWFLYMIINGVERFFIEQIRVNEKYELFGLNWSQAQYISVGFIVFGIIGTAYLLLNKKPGWERAENNV